MSTMNISVPDSLKDFVDEQVNQGRSGTSSEYVRELIRKDQDRLQLRGLLLAGARSAPTKPVDDAYFDSLRRKAKAAKRGAVKPTPVIPRERADRDVNEAIWRVLHGQRDIPASMREPDLI